MDCRIAEQNMQKFLNKTLEGEDLRLFLRHVCNCPACEEELGTSYLIDVALERIENGETVNLKKELDFQLDVAKRFNSLQWVLSNLFRSVEVVAGIALALSAVRVFVMYVIPYISF